MISQWMDLKRFLPVFVFFMVGAQPAHAVITLTSFSNYFRNSFLDSTTNETTIFAGRTKQDIGGSVQDCTVNNPGFTNPAAPCNSCIKLAGTQLGSAGNACNDSEIYQNLPFTVTLRSDDAADYVNCNRLIVGRVVGQETVFAPATDVSPLPTPGRAGQDITATFTWSQLCQAAGTATGVGANTDCSKSFNSKFEFSFDRQCNQSELTTGGPQFRIQFRFVATSPAMTLGCGSGGGTAPAAFEGICNYSIVPGDEKVFVRNTEGVTANGFDVPDLTVAGNDGSSKDASGMKYSSFRVYFRPLSLGAPSSMTYSDSFSDLGIAGTALADTRVEGLTNGVEYVFWGAMVDQAGTVTHFPLLSALTTAQQGTPEKVFGLLDDKGCFVATAAYGSPLAQEIQILREFRDVHLAQTEWGRQFIAFYYKHSPGWAAVIEEHEILRGIVRTFLGPVIGMADMSLRYGAWVFYLSLVSIFSLIAVVICSASLRVRRSGSQTSRGET